MSTSSQPVRLAGRSLKEAHHICAFFRSPEEQNELLMPFFKEGIDRGEKVFNIVDRRRRDAHMCACSEYGIDVASAEASGQLEVLPWEDAYFRDGYFDGDRMIRLLEDAIAANSKKYDVIRMMGNMEWALEAMPGVTDLVEYESKLNYVIAKHAHPAICVYDLNRHSGSVVMDILRTHPMVIVGGVLQENPMYVPPDQFLKELESRKQAVH